MLVCCSLFGWRNKVTGYSQKRLNSYDVNVYKVSPRESSDLKLVLKDVTGLQNIIR